MNHLQWEWQILDALDAIRSDFMTKLFSLITQLGGEMTFIILICLLYLCIDKKKGEKLGFMILFASVFNGALKGLFQAKRPFEFSGHEHLRKLEGSDAATCSSFPSGHSQNSASSYGGLALLYPKKWLIALMVMLIILIPISRLYLGVHFPIDVIVGLLLGLLSSVAIYYLYQLFDKKQISYFYLYGLIIVLFIPFLFFTPHNDLFKVFGLMLGFIMGLLIEKKFIAFTLDVPLWKKILRLVLCLTIIILIKEGLKLILPKQNIFHIIRYFLISFIGFGVLPFAFKNKHFPHGL